MNRKNNQRFRETELRMEAAMLDLMKDMEFERITVKRICERAQVNRSTFYAHFIDIYDMLDKMERELRKELLKSYGEPGSFSMFSEESFLRFLKHIRKHRYFYRVNLRTRTSFPLKQGYDRLWQIIESRCRKAGIADEEETLYYFISFQAGFTMILKHWVDTDCGIDERAVAKIIRNSMPSILTDGETDGRSRQNT